MPDHLHEARDDHILLLLDSVRQLRERVAVVEEKQQQQQQQQQQPSKETPLSEVVVVRDREQKTQSSVSTSSFSFSSVTTPPVEPPRWLALVTTLLSLPAPQRPLFLVADSSNCFCTATLKGGGVYLHAEFVGWGNRHDMFITPSSGRIRPLFSSLQEQETFYAQLTAGTELDIMDGWHKWHAATVISRDDVLLQVKYDTSPLSSFGIDLLSLRKKCVPLHTASVWTFLPWTDALH